MLVRTPESVDVVAKGLETWEAGFSWKITGANKVAGHGGQEAASRWIKAELYLFLTI